MVETSLTRRILALIAIALSPSLAGAQTITGGGIAGNVTPASIGASAVANNGSDFPSPSQFRVNLGLGSLSGINTWSGAQTFSSSSTVNGSGFFGGAAINGELVRLTTNAGFSDTIQLFKGSAATGHRWDMALRADNETGLNAGSGLQILSYLDTGATPQTLLFGNRASGPLGNGSPYFSQSGPFTFNIPKAVAPNGIVGNDEQWGVADAQPSTSLPANPLATDSGSPIVTVTSVGCCGVGGQLSTTYDTYVNLTGATSVGGITPSSWLQVASIIDANTFTVSWSANATSTATGGGTSVAYTPSFPTATDRLISTDSSGASGFSIQGTRIFASNPAFYKTGGGNNPNYQQHFWQFYTPPDASGTKNWLGFGLEWDLINRGKDSGYSPIIRTATNATVGQWLAAWPTISAAIGGAGTAHNWNTLMTCGANINSAIVGGFSPVHAYDCLSVQPSSLVGATIDPTGHGGVGYDAYGAYSLLALNPFTSHAGASNVTIALGSSQAVGEANGNTVFIPGAYTFDGVSFGNATYSMSNVTSSSIDITATGTATTGITAGGANQVVFLTDEVPYSPAQFGGEWKHGIITTNFKSDSGYILEPPVGAGIGWSDGTGTASIQTTQGTAGNISITLSPSGTGTLKTGAASGVSCAGTPTSSFATVNGLVTHC